jgi:ABC-type dipeptide/oligopeptide/nickel transport system ATPase component
VTRGNQVRLLSDVSLDAARLETVGVVGVSGCGKSVLASAILGLLRTPPLAVEGSIKLSGKELIGMQDSELRSLRGSEASLIVSNARLRLNPLLPVGEQVIRAIREKRPVSKEDAANEARALLESVGIGDPDRRMRALPSELSGGMCQRIVIAMGICNQPSLIVADEPTSGLDVTIQTQVLTLIRDLIRQGAAAMLLMTRDLGVVAHFCDRVIVMEKGRIVEQAGVREFFNDPKHPHSQMLLDAAFASRGKGAKSG